MRAWLLWCLVAAVPALAAETPVMAQGNPEVHGFTQDSRFFVFSSMEGDVALDLKTGQTVEASVGDVDGSFEAWKKKHPLAPLQSGRSSGDGKATAEVKPTATDTSGAWDDGKKPGSIWTPTKQTGAELKVERGGKSWVSVTWPGGIHTVTPYWSPDGKSVAWLIHPSDWYGMDGSTSYHLVTGPAGYARIHLLAEKGLLKEVAPKVREQLEQAGFVTTYLGKAQKARDATVVYAAEGQEELAQQLAQKVPGGATVDKLTWKVNAELVVALGKSAGGAR